MKNVICDISQKATILKRILNFTNLQSKPQGLQVVLLLRPLAGEANRGVGPIKSFTNVRLEN